MLPWKLTACCGLVAGLALGCGEEEKPVDQVQARMEEETRAFYRQIEVQPDPNAHFQLARVYQKYGLLDSARSAYERSIALRPAFPDAHFHLAQIYYAEGNTPGAIDAYKQVVRYRSADARAHNNLGFIYKKTGELDEAEAAYRKAIDLDPEFVEAYNNLGQLYKQRNELERALGLYRKAIAIKTDFPEAYVNLAMAYRSLEDEEGEGRVLRDYLDRFGTNSRYGHDFSARLQELEGP